MKYPSSRIPLLAFVAIFALATTAHAAYTERVLYTFKNNGADAIGPQGLVADSAGNLYGIANQGGAFGLGAIFELSPSATGWTETVIYSFAGGTDGSYPGGSLVIDASGNLYGADAIGGLNKIGEVFELSPSSAGWTKTSLYSFTGKDDGGSPIAPLTFDSAGNLYGAGASGGLHNEGVIFELSLSSAGWTEKVLYAFSVGAQGFFPISALTIDSGGRLYGFTYFGGTSTNCGASGCGTVYQLSPPTIGTRWTYRRIHAFNLTDGGMPGNSNNLLFDPAGNLYGCTSFGGNSDGHGVVFVLSPLSSGNWKESVLHSFTGGYDGYEPNSLAFDPTGHLWGTALNGGSAGYGTAFELAPVSGGHWIFARVYAFQGGKDGVYPRAKLLFDNAGNIFGTTSGGGFGSVGTFFELSPAAALR